MTGHSSRTALLLSPHLDDVVFSCGGIAAMLASTGWRVVVATAFTRPVHPASGFALECQRDKGLADDVDYMALRQGEDRAACEAIGAEPLLLDLPEAPNRGYVTLAALFGQPHEEDTVAGPLAGRFTALLGEERPALVLAPQGCGRHVDHARLIDAVLDRSVQDGMASAFLGFYRDTPYVIRDARAAPDPRVDTLAPHDIVVPIDDQALSRKLDAVACYGSQLGFQFGGEAAARDALAALAKREAGDAASAGTLAERLRTADPDRLASVLS